MNLKVSVIAPCYNEEAVIETTYDRLTKVMSSAGFADYELVFINDGSRDNTLNLLEKFASNDPHVMVVSFSRNFGHQPAVSAGIHHATGDVAVIIDSDLQDPPEIIPEMVKLHLEQKANVVYGVRDSRKGETWFKKVTAKMFYRFINSLSEVKLPLDTGDFRLIDRKVMDMFKKFPERSKYIRGLITWIGFKQVPIHYNRDARLAGETKYPLSKMIKFATTGLLYFSKKPLKLAMNLGFFSIVIGLLLSLYTLVTRILVLNNPVPGWASLMIAVIFFGGIQLLTIGVLGEYLGSMFDEMKGRPEYIVDRVIKKN